MLARSDVSVWEVARKRAMFVFLRRSSKSVSEKGAKI